MSKVRMFPIQDGPSIPYSIMQGMTERCRINHGQTLERIAERGGLSYAEAFAVVSDMSLSQLRLMGYENAKKRWVEYADLIDQLDKHKTTKLFIKDWIEACVMRR